jgi:hypothetical protein
MAASIDRFRPEQTILELEAISTTRSRGANGVVEIASSSRIVCSGRKRSIDAAMAPQCPEAKPVPTRPVGKFIARAPLFR